MKRIAIFGSAVAAALAMYGCGGSAPEPSTDAAPSPGVEVTPPAADTEIPSSVTPMPSPVDLEPVPAPAEEEAPVEEAPAEEAPAEEAPAEEMPAEESETPAVEPGDSEAAAPSADLDTLALKIDPVCKMSLEGIPIVGTAEHEGKSYGFCAALCKKKFEEDPAAMLARLAPKPKSRPDK